MPLSPPLPEHTPRTSPRGNEASAIGVPEFAQREPVARSEPAQHGTTLPPVALLAGYSGSRPQADTSPESGSPAAVRAFGMHSILNPAADMELPRQAQRISQSPGRSVSAAYGPRQTPLLSPRVRKRKDDASPGRTPQGISESRQNRRLLTPKSPMRSLSQGTRGSPSGGGLGRLPLAPSEARIYTAEPGAETRGGVIPPLPPMAMSSQSPYASAHLHEPTVSTGPASHSNSTTSYSANNQGYAGSPGSSSNVPEREVPSPFRSSLADQPSYAPAGQAFMLGAEAQNRPIQRSYGVGQPAYQMKLDTEQGPMIVPVELDIQQASKLADEKRKRNAGASARFRQRRKEKEQAASQAIADLQRQLREVTDERDYYMGERNFLRDFVTRTPGIQIPPRAPSPPSRRIPSHMVGATIEGSSNVDYGRRDMAEPSPAQRRRTSDYQPSFAAASPIAPANYAPSYPPPQVPSYALPPPSLPGPLQDPRSQPPAAGPPTYGGHPPGPPPLNMRPQQYDPFRRDNNPR
ncbi:hypothetical protein H2198_005256 [Neophaeococcomyces mojaviensis]|uniref:Uncharacterized protein n=1 Tax=Neophaeococcomyces mojaviensis TaxID=3383035 RepID=A0ACC3A663_9EURO|nr:hypothetical protein H2198_005256 [Knufia sp. JES_112]